MPLTSSSSLTPAQLSRRRRNRFVFDIFDTDGSGLLDTREIKWLLPFYEAPCASFPDHPELLSAAARGRIKLDTAVDCVQKTSSTDDEFGLHWIIVAADEDNDGKVSKSEWLHFLEARDARAVWRLPFCCLNIVDVPCIPDCFAARYFYFWGHSVDWISRTVNGLNKFVVGGSVEDTLVAEDADEDTEVDGREQACFNCNTPLSKHAAQFARFAFVIFTVAVGLLSIARYFARVAKSVLRLAIGRAFFTDAIEKFVEWRGCAVAGECELVGSCGASVQRGWLFFTKHSALCSDVDATQREREMKLTTAFIVVLPVVWYGLKQLVELLPCCREHQKRSPKLVVRIILFLIAVALVEYWSEQIDWDPKLKLSMFELPIADILITAFAVEYLREQLSDEKRNSERAADWREHKIDRRRINVSLNMIDADGHLALRRLSEQPLSAVFPSPFVQNALADLAEEMEGGDIERRRAHGSIVMLKRCAKSGAFGFARASSKRRDEATRLRDQITNFISASHGPGGFIDIACGVKAVAEVSFAWALTYEKLDTPAQNQKFRVLLCRADLLEKVLCKSTTDVVNPALPPIARKYFAMRWEMLRKMARIYQNEPALASIKRPELLMSISREGGTQLRLACRGEMDAVKRPWMDWTMRGRAARRAAGAGASAPYSELQREARALGIRANQKRQVLEAAIAASQARVQYA